MAALVKQHQDKNQRRIGKAPASASEASGDAAAAADTEDDPTAIPSESHVADELVLTALQPTITKWRTLSKSKLWSRRRLWSTASSKSIKSLDLSG